MTVINERAVVEWRRKRRAPGMVERSACQRLRALASRVPADQAIVELGAFKGRSTGWLLLGAQDGHGAHVTSVDPWGARRDDYVGRFQVFTGAYPVFEARMARIGAGPDRLTVRRGYAADVGRSWSGPSVGLLWHDAGHGVEDLAEDLTAWAPHVAPGGVVVCHDACQPAYGVVEGARTVLDSPGWDWAGRAIHPWAKHPRRRGVLVVRRAQ